jgi:hypothetical protein
MLGKSSVEVTESVSAPNSDTYNNAPTPGETYNNIPDNPYSSPRALD